MRSHQDTPLPETICDDNAVHDFWQRMNRLCCEIDQEIEVGWVRGFPERRGAAGVVAEFIFHGLSARAVGALFLVVFSSGLQADDSPGRDVRNPPANTWVKLSPLADTPPSPRLGYEGACVWDSRHKLVIRYGGHNQGGGGEQNSEMWTFDPRSARWTILEPNTSPPGICCGQQNVFDPIAGRYVRFPAFSASHGWQWRREVYLNDASVWTFDVSANTWRNLRPFPTVSPRPLRCASWDSEHQVIVVFGGEGSSEGTCVYDPWENRWTQMKPAMEPEFRSGGNMAWDARHRTHVLFGSQFTNDPHTWGYDLRTNTWKDMQPPEMPPTDKNDAVLAYDALAGLIVSVIKVTTGDDEKAKHQLETWTYDVGANRWKKMNPEREPDPTGSRARQLMFAPELGVSLLENRPSNSGGLAEQQIWSYRLPPRNVSDAGPPPPTEIAVVTAERSATISWKPAAGDSPKSYAVHRGTGEQPWLVDWKKIAVVDGKETACEDAGLSPGTTCIYRVHGVDESGREGPAGIAVRTQPRLVEDVVVSVLAAGRIEVTWPKSPHTDVVGYHVERAAVDVLTEDQLKLLKKQTPPLDQPSVGAIRRVGAFTRLTTEPTREPKFVDTAVDLLKPAKVEGEPVFDRPFHSEQFDPDGRTYRFAVYAYRVRAVNRLGVTGGASPAILTIPSSPRFVFAKEDGMTCRLKWEANPEQFLKGYRVYRMDGRYDKDPISRLAPEPITAGTFADENAGKATRRYYVVAVDALGQEGFPSSPAWYNREWAPFYGPFVGEWHQ